jgi:hypothetical protein
MQDYLARIRAGMMAAFAPVSGPADLADAADAAFDALVEVIDEDGAMATIWAGVQADPVLLALDEEDSRQNGDLLAELLLSVLPSADRDDVIDACYFATHVSGAVARMSRSSPDGERLRREMKRLIRMRLESLL